MATPSILAELPKYTREAVRFYWETRSRQSEKQREAGGSDQGSRSAVTGGAQMAALEHGGNSIGVECPSPHYAPRLRERERVVEDRVRVVGPKRFGMGRGVEGEVLVSFKQAASRLMNENSSLFGQARFQIELKPHAAVEAVVALQESSPRELTPPLSVAATRAF
jgi:hypothetical protein